LAGLGFVEQRVDVLINVKQGKIFRFFTQSDVFDGQVEL
jgi:hypothetical protein